MNAMTFGPIGAADAGEIRRCRVCGCHAHHACYRPDWGRCSWADADLCSHCVPLVELKHARRVLGRWRLGCLVVLGLWGLVVALSFAFDPSSEPQLRPAEPPLRHAASHPPGVRGAPWPVNA